MRRGRKPGPKTSWQNCIRYNRSKCLERLKPVEIVNISSADAFASRIGRRLNAFATIKFSETCDPLSEFRAGTKRLSAWFTRWGGELLWVYVWEAKGGLHVHAFLHVARGVWADIHAAIVSAFAGHDVDVRPRLPGPSAMAYFAKGTDWVTHWRLRGPSRIPFSAQGVITWKRCGCSQSLGPKARRMAGFDDEKHPQKVTHNCVKTSTRQMDGSASLRTNTDGRGNKANVAPSLVVLQLTTKQLIARERARHYGAL